MEIWFKRTIKISNRTRKINELARQNGTSVAIDQARADLATPPWWQYRTPPGDDTLFQTPQPAHMPSDNPQPPPQGCCVMVCGSTDNRLINHHKDQRGYHHHHQALVVLHNQWQNQRQKQRHHQKKRIISVVKVTHQMSMVVDLLYLIAFLALLLH